ncbi:hypothetical protein [Sinorhizobium meliloti]|uniref:hypothetical protein n=1 Tax=Rhizobium meliloti TaxID=382 RepID=UPI0012FDDABC|nr:hypothetical protein [Sinorhizobium meliloti]
MKTASDAFRVFVRDGIRHIGPGLVSEYKRTHPLIAMVGATLGLADEQIDALRAAAVDC